MKSVKLALIREEKVPIDKRVLLSPIQAEAVIKKYPQIKVLAQRSTVRCFQDAEYEAHGLQVMEDIAEADILLGVKEVPIKALIPHKTYFFFSHTIKKQAYNRKLLQEILAKRITLIDYECLVDDKGNRVIAFGRWAGIVGAYNGLWTYGQATGNYHIRRAHECHDYEDMKREYPKVKLPPLKIVVTGGGRVAKGAMEVLNALAIQKVNPEDFRLRTYLHPVYTQLDMQDYHVRKDGRAFDTQDFYQNPEQYAASFLPFAKQADMLIAAAYWDPRAPKLFSRVDMQQADFKIGIIADVTCDIEGSIPSTLRPCTIDDPVYDYNPFTGEEQTAFSSEKHVHVMAIDNLPCELPRDASLDFGEMFIEQVLPSLLGEADPAIIERATIAKEGALTPHYHYLQDYVNSNL